jgi:hypothetical protein
MRIVAMTNDGQLPMMKNMLNSALKAGFPMDNFHCYILQHDREAAAYNTKEFQSITLQKLEVILSNLHLDREVLWIDNDIFLFKNIIDELRAIPGNMVMQDDLWGPCTGFFLARSTPATIRVLKKTIDYVRSRLRTSLENDQHAFLRVHKSILGLMIRLLPTDEYPNGEIYFNQKQTAKAKMVHNNYLTTTVEKVERFKITNLWDESDVAFNQVNKYYI